MIPQEYLLNLKKRDLYQKRSHFFVTDENYLKQYIQSLKMRISNSFNGNIY